jgi:predicted transcriptional regulator
VYVAGARAAIRAACLELWQCPSATDLLASIGKSPTEKGARISPFLDFLGGESPKQSVSDEDSPALQNWVIQTIAKQMRFVKNPSTTLRRICAERNDPEHLSTLYLRFGSILKQIRKKRGLTIQGLSVLSGVPEKLLEGAESGRFQITDPEMKDLRDVYWTLETDEASAADYKSIVDQRLSKPYPDFGFSMIQIRNEMQISIKELSSISGLPEAVLEAAEAGTVEMCDEVSEEVKRVYWTLSALEATPADYRRLLAEMEMKACGD